MSATAQPSMTRDAFLEWEARQPVRYEFDGMQPVAMTGGTHEHSVIQGNLMTALGNRLLGGSCRAHGGHLKAETARGYRYPDVFVTCGPVERGTTVVRPVVVFEIASPSTSSTDRIIKTREYGATPSIRRYVILEQTRAAATVFSWDTGQWAGIVLDGEVDLPLPEIGVSLALGELYRDVELPPEEEQEA